MLIDLSIMNDDFYIAADPSHIKREKAKARELKKTSWWKQKLAERVCYYCENQFSMDELTMDHRMPIGRGGKTTKGNVVVSCKSCNSQKKHLTPVEMTMKELNKNK